jgi:hypothetical protein
VDGNVFAARVPEGVVVRRAGWSGDVGWVLLDGGAGQMPRVWDAAVMEVLGRVRLMFSRL